MNAALLRSNCTAPAEALRATSAQLLPQRLGDLQEGLALRIRRVGDDDGNSLVAAFPDFDEERDFSEEGDFPPLGFSLPDDSAHSPNEKFDLDCFHAGMRMSAWLWPELAKV